jgi:hypothetical protein
MRGENEPAAGDPSDGGQSDANDASFEDVRIEPVLPRERSASRPTASALVPSWTQRLSLRGKLARALIVALAVLITLAVLFPRSAVPLPPPIARLLTPAPTQTPRPGQFAAGEFEPVPLPVVPTATPQWRALSRHDPATAYLCTQGPGGVQTNGSTSEEITLWVTHNAGQTWNRAPLPGTIGGDCEVEPAIDGSPRVVVNMDPAAPEQNGQVFGGGNFLSEDDGATWRSLQCASLDPSVCPDGGVWPFPSARHLYSQTTIQGRLTLTRSDDGGQTWQRADHGLEGLGDNWFVQPLDGSGEALYIGDGPGHPVILTTLWVTHDAGANWQRVTSGRLPNPPFGEPDLTPIISGPGFTPLITEPPLADAARACQCVVVADAHDGPLPLRFNWRPYSSRDLVHWTPLPPIPLAGTSAQFSGVATPLGMSGDGRFLALGPDPDAGLPFPPGYHGPLPKAAPALWAWDTHTGRWNVSRTHLPCPNPQNCDLYEIGSLGVSSGAGTTGQPRGTWFWIVAHWSTAPVTPHWFRVFVPVA